MTILSLTNLPLVAACANEKLTKCKITRKSAPQRLSLSPPTFGRLFPQYRHRGILPMVSTSGTEAAIKQSPSQPDDVSAPANTTRSKRVRPTRKSEMPPVKDEELIPGAVFTGKVRSIQAFGAFIDFGAFTEGLVHVSRLSDSYVKDVGSVVSVGQEVKVKLLEANLENGRISLSMRENEGASRSQKEASSSAAASDRPKTARRAGAARPKAETKSSKYAVGQELRGTVKNIVRAGSFIALGEGEEGFLPMSEEGGDGYSHLMGESTLEAGQEVTVRVLRISRGQLTLTMKTEEDDDSKMNLEQAEGVVHKATNPFALAFRNNKELSAFLNHRENERQLSSVVEQVAVEQNETLATQETDVVSQAGSVEVEGVAAVATEESEISSQVGSVQGDEIAAVATEESEISSQVGSVQVEEVAASGDASEENDVVTKEAVDDESEMAATDGIVSQVGQAEIKEEANETVAQAVSTPNEVAATASYASDETAKSNKGSISPALVKQLREESGAGMMDCKKALAEAEGDVAKAQEILRKKGLASAEKKASRATSQGRIGSYIHDSRIGVLVEVNCETDFVSRGDIFKSLVDAMAMQIAACPQVQVLSPEDVPESTIEKEKEIEMQKEDLLSKPEQFRAKIVEGRMRKRLEEVSLLEQAYIKNDKMTVKDLVSQSIATIGENIKVRRFIRYNLGEGLEKKTQDFAAEVAAQTATKTEAAPAPPVQTEDDAQQAPAVAVSAALVKQLREETGAGMMDCKKALSESGGDIEKAQEYLRKKGLSAADKKSSRLAAEGRVGSYIHDARIGVLIEVNCETDFVGRSETFKQLVDDLAMQVVACPGVQFVSMEDVPESTIEKEKDIERQREDLQAKPENMRERIVEGRVNKRLGELALLEQPFIKDDTVLVKDLVKRTVAALGENIKVRRFDRFTLGEAPETPAEVTVHE